MLKTGWISIVGKPNVGKSTLINSLANKKISIVTFKPQTTWNQIKYNYKDKFINVIFCDTPGICLNKNKFDSYLNKQIKGSLKQSDLIVLITDPKQPFDEKETLIIKSILKYNVSKILVVNKIDISNKKEIDEKIDKITKLLKFDDIICSSFLNHETDQLLSSIKKNLSKTDKIINPIIENDKFYVSELIREQIYLNTKQELPYSSYVEIEKYTYDPKKNVLDISALINVEKKSQKPIIVGSKAQVIKKISMNTRKQLEKIYDCKINLKVFVKVNEKWKDNENILNKITS